MRFQFCDTKVEDAQVFAAPHRAYTDAAHSNGTFRDLVDNTLRSVNITYEDVSLTKQVVVQFADNYIGWNYAHSHELSTIRKDLFRVINYKSTLLEFGRDILDSPKLNQGAFIGVHLRGEGDWPAGFGSSEDQVARYVDSIEEVSHTMKDAVSTIYVSCGDQDAIQTFREVLKPLGYDVYDKWTLLADRPEKLNAMEAMGFDQKGIVDYEVLVNARFWMGVSMSSMSSLIAYARTVNDRHDFFETHIFPNSSRAGLHRGYADNMVVKGSRYTKLLVVSGHDIMESFP